MNNKYFRITGYLPSEDLTVIMDCNGLFDQLWQFSSDLYVKKGFQILEVGDADKFLDVNITRVECQPKYILRAEHKGKPEKTTQLLNGIQYQAIKVANKIYIPDRNKKA